MALQNRRLAAVLLIGLLAGIAAFWYWRAPSHPMDRQPLVLMSSIDLIWGEAEFGEIARGEGKSDPLFERLNRGRKIVAADNVAQLQATKAKVAMLVQPRPFAPEDLVRIDKWVRAGGRLLFFADPALQWPSNLPTGDPARPLFTSMHSPLFTHWGVELVLPIDADASSAEVEINLGNRQIRSLSPGQWQSLPSGTGSCRLAQGGFVAECRPGKGQAILVADADLLYSGLWQSALPGSDSSSNIDWTEQLLARLETGRRIVGRRGDFLD
ncbi:MAG TPA: hypothetical protein VFV06_02900 [Sphingorhabdus sp.]|nr:hypothetical protein [Sphingorhabdus sp.]